MREFVVLAHEDPGDVSLSDLPGAGRLDLLARAVTASLLTSHGVREESRCWLVFRALDLTVRVEGGRVRRLNPDERSTAARLRDALDAREEAVGHQPVEVSPGVFCSRRPLATVLDAAGGRLLVLREEGDPVVDLEPPAAPTFVLSDHHEFTGDERALLEERADATVSLGTEPLHADQAVVVAHNFLDTGGYERY
jgi:tRNA (pseudouridine54-N1)-methyltransferase